MSKSPLATESYPAYEGNFTYGRSGRKIEAITIHHMAGRLTAKQCGGIFQTPGRCGSSHYGIGYNGEIACYVEEQNTAWTNSNWDSNCKSVTIETADNDNSWYVNDTTLKSLIKLVADIAKRNNLGKLIPSKNLTWHSMFTNTTCPGNYLRSKMQYIADEANKINNETPKPTPSGKHKVGEVVNINGIYTSSTSAEKLNPARTSGTITKIIEGARNPYLLDDGNLGWTNDSCIVSNPAPTPTPSKRYLNLNPDVNSWTVYKTNNYYQPTRTSDVLAKLNPAKFGGLSYEILEDCGNYHFKIKTDMKGIGYIAGNPNKYSCTITEEPIYKYGNY